jgi:hypothetical protein
MADATATFRADTADFERGIDKAKASLQSLSAPFAGLAKSMSSALDVAPIQAAKSALDSLVPSASAVQSGVNTLASALEGVTKTISSGGMTGGASPFASLLVGGGAIGVAAASAMKLFQMVGKTNDELRAMVDAADKAGISLEKIQELKFAANRGGVDDAKFLSGVDEAAKHLNEIKRDGENDISKLLDKNNLKYKDEQGNLVGVVRYMELIAELMARTKDPYDKLEVGDKAGLKEWVNVLGQGPEKLRETLAEAQKVGAVLNGGTLRGMVEQQKAWNEQVFLLATKIESALLPALSAVNNVMKNIGQDWADSEKMWAGWADSLGKVATALGHTAGKDYKPGDFWRELTGEGAAQGSMGTPRDAHIDYGKFLREETEERPEPGDRVPRWTDKDDPRANSFPNAELIEWTKELNRRFEGAVPNRATFQDTSAGASSDLASYWLTGGKFGRSGTGGTAGGDFDAGVDNQPRGLGAPRFAPPGFDPATGALLPPADTVKRPDLEWADKDKKDRDAIRAKMEEYQELNRLASVSYQQATEHASFDAALFNITENQKTAELRKALDQREDAELAALRQEYQIADLSVAQRQGIENKINTVVAQSLAQRQRLQDQEIERWAKEWDSVLGQFQGAWDSQLGKLLSRTETFSQAMKNIAKSLVMDWIKEFEKAALAKVASGLAQAGLQSPQGGVGGAVFSGLFGAAKDMGQTANTTALAGLTVAVTANTAALTGETATTAAADAGGGAGGIFSGLTSLFKMFAIPGFAVGAWEIPSTMPAMLHPGEMVVPAGPAGAFRSAVAGGGSGTSVFAPNITGVMGHQAFLNQVMPQLARMHADYVRRNPSLA